MNTKNLKYKIGDYVTVDLRNEVLVEYTDDLRKLVKSKNAYRPSISDTKKEEIRKGQITGIKTFYEGKIKYGVITYPDDYSPGYLKVSKTIYLWCVRFGYTNKEHYFFEEDISRMLMPARVVFTRNIFIPFKDVGWNTPEGEKAKEIMREESKNYPRDKKGRFA
ncbi:MAG: hypothetical protein SVK08_01805 [Halobacteriota archaeon]|nr:hypothetical protein [Halobacteriota archaeon]